MRIQHKKPVQQKFFYRVNYQITSPTLRIIDEDGKQIGVVSKLEALQKAKERNVDVVEIAPNANPPVAKLIDYKKFKYQEAKKEREAKKTQKNVGVKEIRLRPFIAQNDLQTRLKQAKEFLEQGNQVKITLLFKGREVTKKEFGFSVINQFIRQLEHVKIVREPRMEGRMITAIMARDKKN